jgi:hypothetical protein
LGAADRATAHLDRKTSKDTVENPPVVYTTPRGLFGSIGLMTLHLHSVSRSA